MRLLFIVAALLPSLPARSVERALEVTFNLVDHGTAGGPAVLSIALQSNIMFSCANYTFPTTVRLFGNTIALRIGAVARPPDGLCLTALGPASSSATIGSLVPGVYLLRLDQGTIVDQYLLTVSSERTELSAQQVHFTTSPFQVAYRVAAGAAVLDCQFTMDPRCANLVRQGAANCETLYADPIVAQLAPLETRPGPYSQSWFNENVHRYAPPAFDRLRAVVSSERYRDPGDARCLLITVHSGRGESFSNRNR